MIPAERYIRNLELTRRVMGTRGCVIECGVWRGGMIAGIAEVMGPDRDYFLFDSFEGLPPATALDGGYAARWQKPENRQRNFNNCTASIEEAEAAMRMAGVPRYHLVKGWFKDTLAEFKPPQSIALLRLDCDWYESTLTCLEALYPYMADHSMVLLDDYYHWEGTGRAVNDFLARSQLNSHALRLRQFDDDVAYFMCRSEANRHRDVEDFETSQ